MKKSKSIINLMLCAVGFAAASCGQSDEPSAEPDAGITNLAITVTADELMKSRVEGVNTVDPKPHYCIMETFVLQDGNQLLHLGPATVQLAYFDASGRCAFAVEGLNKYEEYRFVFWAAEEDATLDNEAYRDMAAESGLKDIDLTAISLTPCYLGYTSYKDVKPVDGEEISVELKHAVARIDFEHTGAAPLTAGDGISCSIKGSRFDLDATVGVYNDKGEIDFVCPLFTLDPGHLTGKVMTTYIMAPGDENQQMVELTVDYKKNGGAMDSTPLCLSNVPVRANCRTIIRGDFSKLYNGVQQGFTAELEKEWEDDNNETIPE